MYDPIQIIRLNSISVTPSLTFKDRIRSAWLGIRHFLAVVCSHSDAHCIIRFLPRMYSVTSVPVKYSRLSGVDYVLIQLETRLNSVYSVCTFLFSSPSPGVQKGHQIFYCFIFVSTMEYSVDV